LHNFVHSKGLGPLTNTNFSYFVAFEICCRVPTVGGKELDLHRLFIEVTSRGGIAKVRCDHNSI